MDEPQSALESSEITFINVWKTPSSEHQAKLLEAMKQEAPVLARMSGFRTMTFFASTDGASLVVLTLWRSQEDFDTNIANNPDTAKNRDKFAEWGEPSPNLYRVVDTIRSEDAETNATFSQP